MGGTGVGGRTGFGSELILIDLMGRAQVIGSRACGNMDDVAAMKDVGGVRSTDLL